VKVQGAWLGGKKIDTAKFLEEIKAIDASEHPGLVDATLKTMHSH
jgi:hypothetical protein